MDLLRKEGAWFLRSVIGSIDLDFAQEKRPLFQSLKLWKSAMIKGFHDFRLMLILQSFNHGSTAAHRNITKHIIF